VLLDTSFLVDLLRERARRLRGPATQKLESLGDAELELCVFVLCELLAGAEMSRDPDREIARVTALAETYPVIYPDSAFPALFGKTLAAVTRNGTPVPTMDLLVAVLAKRLDVPVLTRDIEHFGQVPGLRVVDY